MREITIFADRIEEILKEIPVSSYAGFLEESQKKIKKISNATYLSVDVLAAPNLTSSSRNLLEKITSSQPFNQQVRWLPKNADQVAQRMFGELFPSVAVILLNDELLQDQYFKHFFHRNDEQYRLIIIINTTNKEASVKELTRAFNFKTKYQVIDEASLQDKTIEEFFESIIDKNSFEKLKLLAALYSLKPILGFIAEIMQSEMKAVNTRKILNTQNVNITRKEEQATNLSDLTSSTRQILQKSVQEIEKSFRLKYDDLNKPNIGSFSKNLANQVMQLDDFEKQLLAEKSEKVDITINREFQDTFIGYIRKDLYKEFGKDENFIRSSVEEMLKSINQQLKQKGVDTVNFEDVSVPFPEPKRVLDSFCYMNKEYKGELIKKGVTEYFVALRDYTGVIMVAVGLLGPLNGITMLQEFFEKKREDAAPGTTHDPTFAESLVGIFKGFNATIKVLTAVITIAMISYGIYDLRRRIPRRRVEEFDRELGKARELLTQEGKRMYNESSRDWLAAMFNWVKDINQHIGIQVEKNMKDYQLNKVQKANNEKNQQQKQQQTIDLFIKSLQMADKMRDQMQLKYRDIVTEIEKDLK